MNTTTKPTVRTTVRTTVVTLALGVGLALAPLGSAHAHRPVPGGMVSVSTPTYDSAQLLDLRHQRLDTAWWIRLGHIG
jgi:hypothetical protein